MSSQATYGFRQVDVFTETALKGNPLAVVIDAVGLTDQQMAAFANWTNLSETTFLLPPTDPSADYRLRIFTPMRELPFAGHPTLGSCHVWLSQGGKPKGRDIVQECAAGLIRIRPDGSRLAFAAPPLLRDGPVEGDLLPKLAQGLGMDAGRIRAAQWIDNGPGWMGLLLENRAEVLALRPDFVALAGQRIGVVAPWSADEGGDGTIFEVRAFTDGFEDPVTGSLNAGIAQWLIGAGIAPARYLAAQGTALGREGRVHVTQDADGIWIGGEVVTCIEGQVTL
ncbi:PhzF family phenazine biosynthesis protein [Paracoccus caeni]|uniref:PhzF family phenazine biosynthesis protein n=1 Tax=Paracoccus caeni TaxID=657651 RepID=A0A934VZ25_9RHOB|nr:PhzF family phenazine biosynthesis protein [Paracoccus caeni]MBK4215385.1 PhzF family phenazine biosynthesis protein [Paracoccus caeni]